MLIDPGDVGFALDSQIDLRWRFFFMGFFWPVGPALASAMIFRRARRQRLDSNWEVHRGGQNTPPSSSAQAEDPVRRDFWVQALASLEYWIVRLRGR
jgi:hypothetical protein